MSKGFRRPYPPPGPFACSVAQPNEDAFAFCPIPGCGRKPQARLGKGLSLVWCRFHVQRRNRHGDLTKGTYSATELRPYRRAAESYLKPRLGSDFWIAASLKALSGLLDSAGPNERVADVLRMPPALKARAALARMSSRGVSPLRLLVNHLAVTMAVAEDPIQPIGEPDEYRLTQIGKAALRMASGYHSVYSPTSRLDLYQRSSGLALRHLGEAIDTACEHVTQEHLANILALKVARYGEQRSGHRDEH